MAIRPGRAKAISFVNNLPLAYTGNGAMETYPYTVVSGLNLITGLPYVNTLFVGKNGSNSNSGTKPTEPLLTIGAAITAAIALSPTDLNRVGIAILDSGLYVESFTIPDFVTIYGPLAWVAGAVVTGDDTGLVLKRLTPSANSQVTLLHGTATTGTAYVHLLQHDMRAFSGCIGVGNISTAGGVVIYDTDKMFVGVNGIGIGDGSSGFGHVHGRFKDLYLAGNNAIGVVGTLSLTTTLIEVDHILEFDSPTGTTAISVGSTGSVYVDARQVIADTAYSITGAGNLYLECPDVQGTRIGVPALEISNDRIVAPNLPTAAAGLPSGAIWNNGGVLNVVP